MNSDIPIDIHLILWDLRNNQVSRNTIELVLQIEDALWQKYEFLRILGGVQEDSYNQVRDLAIEKLPNEFKFYLGGTVW